MNETLVTVVGNVATKPVFRELSNGSVNTRFRLAVTARWYDRAAEAWKDGHTNFFTVWARKSLAANLASAVSVGEPVIVQGRLRVRDEERGGQRWTSAEIDASTVGHDLSRGTAAFRRSNRAEAAPADPRPEPQFERDPDPGPAVADPAVADPAVADPAVAGPADGVPSAGPPELDVHHAESTDPGPPTRAVEGMATTTEWAPEPAEV